jgi:hypothetical protein
LPIKITRIVLVYQDAVVVLGTGITALPLVLPVLPDTTTNSREVTVLLAVLLQRRRHDAFVKNTL